MDRSLQRLRRRLYATFRLVIVRLRSIRWTWEAVTVPAAGYYTRWAGM
jgi:hypothetical protein